MSAHAPTEARTLTALAHRKDDAPRSSFPDRAQVLARYRHLRSISKAHRHALARFLPGNAIIDKARQLKIVHGRTIVLDREDDLSLVIDLAIYTAQAGRSHAVDRYANSVKLAPGSDEDLVLQAMRAARFAIIDVKQRHPLAGLIVTDLFRNAEVWLVDEGMEISAQNGQMFAVRYYLPDHFAVTCGVLIPIDLDFLEDALGMAPPIMRKPIVEALDDHRFAAAIYRAALETGVMDRVEMRDVREYCNPLNRHVAEDAGGGGGGGEGVGGDEDGG